MVTEGEKGLLGIRHARGIKEQEISADLSYFIEYRYDVINSEYGPITKLPLADQIYKMLNGQKTTFYLPSERRINCIVMDRNGRLNVGTEDTRFEYTVKGDTRIYTRRPIRQSYISKGSQ